MRLVYVSHNYPPEMGALSARVSQLARVWAEEGHQVTVITGFPNFPTGRVHAGYRRKFWRIWFSEKDGRVTLRRTWLWPAPNQGRLRRSLSFLTFCLSAMLRGIFLRGPMDWVIGTSPQLLTPVAAYVIARLHRARFCLEVRDLWPESLIATEVARPQSVFYRLLDRISQFLYRRADKITVVTESFREILINRGVPAAKVCVIKNGVNTSVFRPREVNGGLRRQIGVHDHAVVGYVGTLGLAHGLETLLRAASELRNDRLKFLLIGEGAEKKSMMQKASAMGLDHVIFLDQVPWHEIPNYHALCFATLVPLRKSELFRTVLPSKMFEAMACERPIILSVEGEAEKVVRQADAGLVVPPDDAEALTEAIRRLSGDPELCRRLGCNGRRYVEENHSYPMMGRRYIEFLSESTSLRG